MLSRSGAQLGTHGELGTHGARVQTCRGARSFMRPNRDGRAHRSPPHGRTTADSRPGQQKFALSAGFSDRNLADYVNLRGIPARGAKWLALRSGRTLFMVPSGRRYSHVVQSSSIRSYPSPFSGRCAARQSLEVERESSYQVPIRIGSHGFLSERIGLSVQFTFRFRT